MKFTCTKEHLQKALRSISGIAGRNQALQVLRHTLLKVERGKLCLSATDLEVGILTLVAGKVENEEGMLAVPAKQLLEYVANLPSDHVGLSLNQGTLDIMCGSAHATFQGETAENFPLIPIVREGIQFTIPASQFLLALDETTYAAAGDTTRPELAGVLLVGEGKTLTLAATDSYRLAESRVSLTESLDHPVRIILPLRASQELRRVMEGETDVTLILSAGQALFETPSTTLVSRLIGGSYPDYTQIIPVKSPTTISLMRQDLLRAVRAASVFTTGETRSVLLTTAPTSLRVTATAQEIGETMTAVPADVHGEQTTIQFNHRFLLDALEALSGERVQIDLATAAAPVLFRPEGKDVRTLALVMPIKT